MLMAVAIVAGSASLGQWGPTVSLSLSIIGITFLTQPEDKRIYSQTVNAVIAGFCVFMARLASGITVGLDFAAYLSAFIEALCAMVSGLLFLFIFRMVSGAAGSQPRPERVSQALALFGLFAVGGLRGINLFDLNPGIMVTMAGTLVSAYAGGPAAGALSGVVSGLAACLTGVAGPELVSRLGIIGALAGFGGHLGKTGATLGYFSGGLAMSFFSDSALLIEAGLLEQIAASFAILLVTPEMKSAFAQCITWRGEHVASSAGSPGGSGHQSEDGGIKNTAIRSVLTEIGGLFKRADAARNDPVVGISHDLVADGRKGESLEKNKTLGPSSEMSDVQEVDTAAVTRLFEKVCRDCENRVFCWDECFGDTFERFIGLARKARLTGNLGFSDTNPTQAVRCNRFREVVIHLNHERHLGRLKKQLSLIETETLGCLAYQFNCLSELAKGAETNLAATSTTAKKREPTLKVSVKGTTIAASGGNKSGDIWIRYDLDAGKTLLVLADGMGKGEMAAKQSKDAVKLLKSLMDCGLDHRSCISFLNSALFVAWRPDSFIALDCLIIDVELERAHFYKLGAPPSFIRKGDGNVLAVRGTKPPAGAVTHVHCYGTSEPISHGDLIFLVSDGVFRSSPIPQRAEHMIMMRLGRLKGSVLDDCVRSVVNHSLRYQRQNPKDDITVVGVFIENI